ncbi:MAG: single-stranded-DNA-specific exonuclease RecJ [Anaerolineae bacterium]
MQPKRWRVRPPAPESFINSLPPRILAQTLYNRGFSDPGAARAFMEGAASLGSPFALADVHKAVPRIRAAIKRGEPVVVYGDFDVDGVTATSLLTLALRRLGANVSAYIPDRLSEGYGLNSAALRRLADEGAKLVITVDCGIRSVAEVEDANAAGLDMIITDHHSIGPELPPAYAIINPKRADSAYPYGDLCGVGVAYTLLRALLHKPGHSRVPPPFSAEEYLDLVAIGTVADLVPLTGENRRLVIDGLQALNRAGRPGVRALLQVAGIAPGACDAEGIGFGLGPRINAAGRLENARLAYALLTAEDDVTAAELAEQLQKLNRERQDKTAQMQAIAAEAAGIDDGAPPPLIFAVSPDFHQGIVGLVASRLTEQFYRPAVVVEQGEDTSHGSCRSIPEFHITDALDACADLLVRHGGHAAAAGFTVRNAQIEALNARLLEIANAQLDGQDLKPVLDIDADEVGLDELSEALAEDLQRLEPTGIENPKPILATRRVRVVSPRRVGRGEEENGGKHLAFRVWDGVKYCDAIFFRHGDLIEAISGREVDVAYNLQINEWNGRRNVQLNIQDIHITEGNLL